MWKYVTRRIKDTVEKTYNVLDVRLTWATADNGSAVGQWPNGPPQQQQQCNRKNFPIWCVTKPPPGEKSHSSSSDKEKYNQNQWHFQEHFIRAMLMVSSKNLIKKIYF